MNWKTRIFVACFAAAVTATSAFAAVSAQYRDWATGPVKWITTADETARWKQVRTDADAKAFVDLFWARRDPSPGTPANEFREEFDRRVATADAQFGQARKKGSMTDRGHIFIVLGAPYTVQRINPEGQGTVQTPSFGQERDTIQDYSPRQIWTWEQPRTNIDLGQPKAEIVFVDQYASNDWTLERQARTPVDDLLKRTVANAIKEPNLTSAPDYSNQTAKATPPPAPAPAPVPAAVAAPAGLTTASLVSAVTEMKAAKASPYKPLSIAYAEMLTPSGEFFVPVQLYIPKDANLTADSVTMFFGVIEDDAGNQVLTFEEPAKLSATKGDLYFDKSLSIKPGTYRATLGLAGADGKPVIMTSSPMEIKDLPTTASGVSRLVLASDIHQTEEAALMGAPFAFGRVKIVPKGDSTFTNRDEINYFLEIVNPTLDEGTNLPKLQVKIDLQAAPGKDGKPGRKISAPPADVTALPLTGAPGPGQYALMAGIPLGEMKNPLAPGDYTFRVTVYDQVGNKNWTAEQKLKLVAAPAAPAAAK
ncbi:MAG: GWxTD domain-containing protein [Thermoanaerobaculia bacterium]